MKRMKGEGKMLRAIETFKYKNLERLRRVNGMSVNELMEQSGCKGGRNKYYDAWQDKKSSSSISFDDCERLCVLFGKSFDFFADKEPFIIDN